LAARYGTQKQVITGVSFFLFIRCRIHQEKASQKDKEIESPTCR
jgi:hypothetical protein